MPLTGEPSDSMPVGRVLKYHSNFYYVEVGGVLYACSLKGLLKKEGSDVHVGDAVRVDNLETTHHTGRIVQILPRHSRLSRPKVANVEQVVIVHSLTQPGFDPHLVDRYITHARLAGLSVLLCVTKCDLTPEAPWDGAAIRALYGDGLGYPVVLTSIHEPDSLAALSHALQGKISVLAGPSGAGKSSLLNALQPAWALKVGEVSEKIARGQHTTRHVELLELAAGTYIADSPGFSHLKFTEDTSPREIEAVFPEFEPYRQQCGFRNCLHWEDTLEGAEEDTEAAHQGLCAVLAHRHELAPSRYASYQEQIAEARIAEATRHSTSQKEAFGYKTLQRSGQEALQILRLKEKARADSRRKQRQSVTRLLDEEPDEEEES